MLWIRLSGVLYLLLTLTTAGLAQTISGVIYNTDGEAVQSAEVSCIAQERGVFSDSLGQFTITCADSDSLYIDHLSHIPKAVPIPKSGAVIIQLEPNAFSTAMVNLYALSTQFENHTEILPVKTKLTTAELASNDESSYAPLLNRVPGVFMQEGALNTNRIAIRGVGSRSPFGTNRLEATLDGIPLNNGNSELVLEDFDLSTLGSIQVLRGPTPSTLGARLGGLIQLSTPELGGDAQSVLTASSTLGDYGLRRNTLRLKHAPDNRHLLLVNLHDQISDGYRDNNRFRRYGLSTVYKQRINKNEALTIVGTFTRLRAAIPSSLNLEDFENNPTQAAPNWASVEGSESYRRLLAGGTYTARFHSTLQQSSTIFAGFRSNYEVRPFNILRENSSLIGARSNWTLKPHAVKGLKLTLGGYFLLEDYDQQLNEVYGSGNRGAEFSDIREDRNQYQGYLQADLSPKSAWNVSIGINILQAEYLIRDRFNPDSSNIFSQRTLPSSLSPYFRGDIKWHQLFNLSKLHWQSSLQLARGTAIPTLEEAQLPSGLLNQNVKIEEGWNIELTNHWQLGDDFSIILSAYSMQIENLLVSRQVEDQFIGFSAGETQHNGLELAVSYTHDLGAIETHRLTHQLSYTFTDYEFTDFVDGNEDYSGNALTGIPQHQLNYSAQVNIEPMFFNVQYQFVDELPLRDDNSLYSEAYQLLNFQAGVEFEFLQQFTLQAFGGVNNIFDESYASMFQINASSFGGAAPRYYYPGLPRNVYAGIRVHYKFR